MSISEQVHGKFKVFVGQGDAKSAVDTLTTQVAAWANGAHVAPKSIGVEYLESAKRIVLTIGYRDDEPAYPIHLDSVHIGRIETLDAAGVARLEKAMADATAKLPRIICHEIYVTEASDFHMVFMRHESK